MSEHAATRPKLDRPRRWPLIVAFLTPALLLYAVFLVYPIVQGARYSLYDWNGFGDLTDFVGFANFTAAFEDDVFRGALAHNVIILVLTLLLQLPFALFLAVLLDQNLRGRTFMRVLFFAPFALSEVVTAVVWRQILGQTVSWTAPSRLRPASHSRASGSRTQTSSCTPSSS